MKKYLITFLLLGISFHLKAQVEPLFLYKASQDPQCRAWVDSVFNTLSLKERVGQLFIYTIAPDENKANMALLKSVVESYKVGGLLFSKGELETQALITNRAQEMADVPLMITFDGEWGLSMRIKHTPVYSRNMVLGCITNERLIYEYGKEVARQCRELGVHVNFAPVADVNINPRNPVINTRSFGEDPRNVANKVLLFSLGMESENVLSVSKHFPGHGDTETDSHHALPFLNFTRQRLDSVELIPFKKVVDAGLSGMMVGHLEVPALEPRKGLPSSLSANVVQKTLVDEMGFRGLIFTDALEMKGVAGVDHVSLAAIMAGNDMVLAPRKIKEELDAVIDAVKKGTLSEEEVNRKCRKVLTYKYILGLAQYRKIQVPGLSLRINTEYAKALGEQLNKAAVTVAGNRNQILPLDPGVKEIALLNVGEGTATFAQALKEYVGVTEFRIPANATPAQRKALRDSLAKYKRIIVAISERKLASYAAFFAEVPADAPIVYIFFTPEKPMIELEAGVKKAAAVVLAHSTERYIQSHLARVLFGKESVDGRLSTGVGTTFKAGDGVTLTPPVSLNIIPEDYGVNSKTLTRIDDIALEGITEGAYPGCQVVVMKEGKTIYSRAFGTLSGKDSDKVTPHTIYDIASLTKTSATLLAVMRLYDKGEFSLSDKASAYLPFLKGTDKAHITIRELLLHEAGLPSSIPFYLKAIDKESYEGRLFKAGRDATHTVQLDAKTYANPKFRFYKEIAASTADASHTLQVTDNLWLQQSFKDSIAESIVSAKPRAKSYLYSCIGFILLQKLVEQVSGMPLDQYLNREFYIPMGLIHTGYQPLQRFQKNDIAPSSNDRFLRKSILQGYVHDEAAAFQGGVSGNAGLFSTAEEIALIHQMILNGGELNGKRYLSAETCKFFTTEKSNTSRRGLGFDRPDKTNPKSSSASTSVPASSYGHTGFTGTIAWVDPRNKLVYVFLSNRTYPNVWVNNLAKLQIRERIQEVIYEAIK